MMHWIELIVDVAELALPLAAVAAIVALYSLSAGKRCACTECVYLGVLLLVSAVTIRTVVVDHCCWLPHTSSLGAMVLAGVLRRPTDEEDAMSAESAQPSNFF